MYKFSRLILACGIAVLASQTCFGSSRTRDDMKLILATPQVDDVVSRDDTGLVSISYSSHFSSDPELYFYELKFVGYARPDSRGNEAPERSGW